MVLDRFLRDARRWRGPVREWVRWVPLPLVSVLVAVDALFVLLHHVMDGRARWSLGVDRGYAEVYGYGKTLASAAFLLLAHRATRQRPYRAVAAVLVVVALDDALSLHEGVGRWFARSTALEPPFGLRPGDVGELSAWAVLGVLSVALLVRAHGQGDTRAQQCLVLFAGLLTLLVGFAVGMDVIHATLSGDAAFLFGMAEDGGELGVLSLLLCLAVALHRRVEAEAMWTAFDAADHGLASPVP